MRQTYELALTRLIDATPEQVWDVMAARGGSTRYTARARHWTDEARKSHAEMGFHDGWGACADQLQVLCEEVAPPTRAQA